MLLGVARASSAPGSGSPMLPLEVIDGGNHEECPARTTHTAPSRGHGLGGPVMRTMRIVLAVAALLLAAAPPARASLIVKAFADADGPNGGFIDVETPPAEVGAPVQHAMALSGGAGGPAAVWSPTSFFCPFCSFSDTARGFAEGDTTKGTLKARASANLGGGNESGALVQLRDTVTFGGPFPAVLNLHVDLNTFFGDVDFELIMRILSINGISNPDAPPSLIFSADAGGYVVLDGDGNEIESGPIPPSSRDFAVFLPTGLSVDFTIALVVHADPGIVALDQSVFLGIPGPFVSLNGYSYPGFQGPGPGPGPVPLPATGVLVLVGLVAVGLARRRTAR